MYESRKRAHAVGGADAAAGLKGKTVLVPSSALTALEQVHGHGKFLHGMVKGKDSGHKDCVLIKCQEDPRTFYFDAGQVRDWLEKQEQDEPVTLLDVDIPGLRMGAEEERGQSRKRTCKAPASSEDTGSMPSSSSENGMLKQGGLPRQRPPSGPPKKGVTKKAEVADLLRREVDIPGAVFHDPTPGTFFRAYIVGPDSGHASAVVVRMLHDSRSRFYFHASEVRDWLRMMQIREASAHVDDSEMDVEETLDEAVAAQVLANMSAGGSSPPASPFCSNPAIPAAKSPRGVPSLQPWQQRTHALSLPPISGRASQPLASPKHLLHWGPTELLVQRSSLLPPSLAEHLMQIVSLQSKSAPAAQEDGSPGQVEWGMVQGEQQHVQESKQQPEREEEGQQQGQVRPSEALRTSPRESALSRAEGSEGKACRSGRSK